MNSETSSLIDTLLATAEVCGVVMNPAAGALMVEDLRGFPIQQVMGALRKCRREVKGRLTLADIVNRLDDGRPSPDEAYAMIPAADDEDSTAMMTREMMLAMENARHLDDRVARRLAFRDAYTRLVQEARETGRPVEWTVSLGQDPSGRAEVLADAVQRGRIGREYAARVVGLPVLERAEAIAAGKNLEALSAPAA